MRTRATLRISGVALSSASLIKLFASVEIVTERACVARPMRNKGSFVRRAAALTGAVCGRVGGAFSGVLSVLVMRRGRVCCCGCSCAIAIDDIRSAVMMINDTARERWSLLVSLLFRSNMKNISTLKICRRSCGAHPNPHLFAATHSGRTPYITTKFLLSILQGCL